MISKKAILCLFMLLTLCLSAFLAFNAEEANASSLLKPAETTSLIASSEMSSIASGAWHTCALTQTGGVMCWGSAFLGNNSPYGSYVPVHVSGLSSGVKSITAGGSHTCALTNAGAALCWGQNTYGQLGNDSTDAKYIPTAVIGLSSGVSAIAAGFYHTCALTTEGKVKCWGYNFYGQLGNNSTTDSLIPVDVIGLPDGIVAIAAGGYHTCALTESGGVMCWGFNTSGQLGAEPITRIMTPVNVFGLSGGVTAISAGSGHSCAISADGGALCWGSNATGQLGNNNTDIRESYIPINVYDLSSEVNLLASVYAHHACAVTSSGSAKCWGYNWHGELGNDSNVDSYFPVDVIGLSSGVSSISGGLYHTCALLISGGVKCWGDNSGGQLGNDSLIGSRVPVDVVNFGAPSTVIKIFKSIGAVDGWILESAENSNMGNALDLSASIIRLGDDAARKQYRSILSFNTGSALPDNAVITKATLKIYKKSIAGGGNPVVMFNGFMVDIKKGLFGGSSLLQSGDFQSAPSKTYGPFNPVVSGGWYSINLTGGKSYLNKLSASGGITQIRLRFKLDDNNNGAANYLNLYSGNAAAAYQPKLIIEYYLP